MMTAGIEYEEVGEGPPVIYLHGIGGGTTSFAPQLEGMAEFRNIAWNMPGYGKSEAEKWPPDFASLSSALARFIAALGLDKAHIVGQSIGGMVALDHAIRNPDQVATLTFVGTTPSFGGRDETFKDTFLKARLAPMDAGMSMAQMAEQAAPALCAPGASEECLAAVRAPMEKVSERTWRGILECLVTFNCRDGLPSINLPCCLIAGAHDRNAPPRTMEKMAAQLPDAEYHLISGSGHMINQEAPNATNKILKTFIGKHAA